jgi:hypothetical protein
MLRVIGEAHRNLHRETWRWADCQNRPLALKDSFPRDEPRDPLVGQGWFDEKTEHLCVWNGDYWVAIPKD